MRDRPARLGWLAAAATALCVLVASLIVAPSPVSAGTRCGGFGRTWGSCLTADVAREAATPVSTSPVQPGSGPCGGERPARPGGGTWTCTFDDEFTGSSLNRNVWTVQTTGSYGYHSGDECLVDNPANVSVSGGVLRLSALRMAKPFVCTSPHGSYTTQYTSGSVYTTAFAQLYGRFEIRARFAEAHGVPGLQGALWLYPRYGADSKHDNGPTEIDIAEAYSNYPNLVMPTAHAHGGGTQNCSVPDYGSAFHTYAAEWSPNALTFYYDGVPCFRVSPRLLASNGLRSTSPFFVALTQALGARTNVAGPDTPLPGILQVDYVRVWK